MQVKVKSTGEIKNVLAIDYAGVCIRKGEPSVIVDENDGCLRMGDVEILSNSLKDVNALDYAISIILSYEMELRNSCDMLGINLIERGFCQGRIYKEALQRIDTLRKEVGKKFTSDSKIKPCSNSECISYQNGYQDGSNCVRLKWEDLEKCLDYRA